MSGANYFWCPVCDSKALYDHTDEPSEVEGVTVLHDECLDKLKREAAAEALREFANANRFPSDWIMFRRNDGSGVTVSDLLRETAAGKLRAAERQAEGGD